MDIRAASLTFFDLNWGSKSLSQEEKCSSSSQMHVERMNGDFINENGSKQKRCRSER